MVSAPRAVWRWRPDSTQTGSQTGSSAPVSQPTTSAPDLPPTSGSRSKRCRSAASPAADGSPAAAAIESSLAAPVLPTDRFRVSRARLAYIFERYAVADELVTVAEAMAEAGVTREALALLVLQGRLAVAEAVKQHPEDRPPRLLLRAEVEALKARIKQEPLPFG